MALFTPWALPAHRRLMVLVSTLTVLRKWKVDLKTLERTVGKHSYVQAFRPSLRSTFQDVYGEIEFMKAHRLRARRLSSGAWSELLA